jgi:pyruvate ferredoxin oxidoreductase alpha subunit
MVASAQGIANVYPVSRLPQGRKKVITPHQARQLQALQLGIGQILTMVGNHAVAHAVIQAMFFGGSTAAFPITPSTEELHEIRRAENNGLTNSIGFNASQEHAAMSATIGASYGGARTFIATSSVGLAHMAEMVEWAGQNRMPIVMADVNRAKAPLNIWHSEGDRAGVRDYTVQLVAENHQQAYDLTLQAFRIAERARWMTIVNLAGFFISHSAAQVRVLPHEIATNFVGEYIPPPELDPFSRSISKGGLMSPTAFPLQRAQNHEAWGKIPSIIQETHADFGKISGRSPGAFFNTYHTKDAEHVFLNYGFLSGTLRTFVDQLRAHGVPVGLISGTMLRPFPGKELVQTLSGMQQLKTIAVFDGNLDPVRGPIYTDLTSAIFEQGQQGQKFSQGTPLVAGFRHGGGQNPPDSVINGVLQRMMDMAKQGRVDHPVQQLDRNSLGNTVKLDLTDSPAKNILANQVIVEFHGRGGLGAVSAAANLANIINETSAAAQEKGEPAVFAKATPEFGSEKTGSPTSAVVVYDNKPIESYSIEGKRNLLVYFRPDLIKPAQLENIEDGGFILVNTPLSPTQIRKAHQVPDSVKIYTINASKVSQQVLGKDLPNNVLLAILTKLRPELLTAEQLGTSVETALKKKGAKIIEGNLRLIEEASDHLREEQI